MKFYKDSTEKNLTLEFDDEVIFGVDPRDVKANSSTFDEMLEQLDDPIYRLQSGFYTIATAEKTFNVKFTEITREVAEEWFELQREKGKRT